MLVFNVYSSPNDPEIVFGYHSPYRVMGGATANWLTMNYGIPVEDAFQETLSRADLNSIPYVLVHDPARLFPATLFSEASR